jgi:hypothetical protein
MERGVVGVVLVHGDVQATEWHLCAEGIVVLMGMGKPSDAHQAQGGERRERAKQHLERLDGIKPHAREGEAGEAGEYRERCERDAVRR